MLRYYKKFPIQDLDRVSMPMDKSKLSHSFANNTLIITVIRKF